MASILNGLITAQGRKFVRDRDAKEKKAERQEDFDRQITLLDAQAKNQSSLAEAAFKREAELKKSLTATEIAARKEQTALASSVQKIQQANQALQTMSRIENTADPAYRAALQLFSSIMSDTAVRATLGLPPISDDTDLIKETSTVVKRVQDLTNRANDPTISPAARKLAKDQASTALTSEIEPLIQQQQPAGSSILDPVLGFFAPSLAADKAAGELGRAATQAEIDQQPSAIQDELKRRGAEAQQKAVQSKRPFTPDEVSAGFSGFSGQ